ncbi:MAG: carboxypeptidase regulatory-like domain-containing protein, partial [Isosphaeraceae bacterium]|nr:carboxypeptidase regulatory-like domain-containing protein [Isosphaeraceae bacterium]
MNDTLWRTGWLAGWAVAVALGGCGDTGDGLSRQAISGTVTLDGQPLARGTIQFLPISPQQATPALVEIKDGTYTIPRDRGLVPGTYKVLISSTATEAPAPGADELPGQTGPPPKDLIPPQYN